MSFSALLTALNEYVADALVNDCGRPEPTRQLSYHGRMPNDCCTADGFLVTSWESAKVFPPDSQCVGIPQFTINIRYVVCWDIPEVGDHGVDITDEQDATWNNDALMLADVADCVMRRLQQLTCSERSTVPPDPIAEAVLAQIRPQSLRLAGVSPIVPLGGCAGVQWQLNAVVLQGPVIS